jgi:hypothetical protein
LKKQQKQQKKRLELTTQKVQELTSEELTTEELEGVAGGHIATVGCVTDVRHH